MLLHEILQVSANQDACFGMQQDAFLETLLIKHLKENIIISLTKIEQTASLGGVMMYSACSPLEQVAW